MTNVYLNTLEELAGGQTAVELHQHFRDLIGAVRTTGKKGSLTLTLVVKPGPNASSTQLLIEDAVAVKPPKVGRDVSVFFADDHNLLSRNDPRQPKLWPPPAASPVPAAAAAPLVVHPVTGEIAE